MARNKEKEMSTKQKARKLFWGMLAPLLTVTIVACTFCYYVSVKIIDYYLEAQLSYSVEKIESGVVSRIDPITVNVDNFSTFATSFVDDKDTLLLLITAFSKDYDYASAFYYGSVEPASKGGFFLHGGGWVPPSNFDATTRGWFKTAIKNPDKVNFSDPYIDADTEQLAVSISKAIRDTNGKIRGVVGCDIILSKLLDILNEISLSANSSINLISGDGYYMTNKISSKVMTAKWTEETTFNGDLKQWFNGDLNILVNRKNFYAIKGIGSTPWFIVSEGPKIDFTGQLSNFIIVFEILLFVFSIFCSVMNIITIRKMRKGEQELGAALYEETQTLVVAAKENAATSQDQSAAVKEIVATMEDSNALSESISSKIKDVSKVAEKTSLDVADGVASIEENVAQLHAIFDANQQTIDGMKVLSDKIESIWDIVTLINNVADQAKIIAFNAELEASSAGEAGKSFRIVANEIRRLSDGIIDGTKEIKEKINEIQHSSDSLILASESGTEKINAGYENAKSLGERFASIKDSAEITASSAGDITDIIMQQTNSSEQILIALKQISAGVENFATATDNISASSEHIRKMSENLNNTVQSSDEGKKK